jgi:hypothetical protein
LGGVVDVAFTLIEKDPAHAARHLGQIGAVAQAVVNAVNLKRKMGTWPNGGK